MDLDFIRKHYLQDWGGCKKCGSKDLDFSESGKALAGLPTYKVKCKSCGEEGETMGIID